MAVAFACRLGLLAFAATALDAAWAGTDLSGGITAALVRLAAFYALGLVCGGMAGWLVEEQAQQEFERWKAAADAPPATAS
ncbi:MAG: hypothetical protein B7Z55_03095 [Planctomycetales bacterium 12-60-4]|nr:MAG: hypothetical protein B7Z55_03095 [Planctomycetales bacterium 12-60-4]